MLIQYAICSGFSNKVVASYPLELQVVLEKNNIENFL